MTKAENKMKILSILLSVARAININKRVAKYINLETYPITIN